MIVNKRPSKLSSTLQSKNKYQPHDKIAQLPLENNASELIIEKVSPKKGHQQDRYEGPVDPVNNLRQGSGTYHYSNKFFTYHGQYKNGKKNGNGELRLGNRTLIKGKFVDDELIGEAEISYEDGSTYKGHLEYGEKCGYGKYVSKLYSYQGQYKDNKKEGKGIYKNSRQRIEGQFVNDKPHGFIKKSSFNYAYEGCYQCGLKSGKGIERSKWMGQEYQYDGQFQNDKFNGEGQYMSKSYGNYQYKGEFENGVPKLYPNQFKVSYVVQPIDKESEDEKIPQAQNFTVATNNSVIEYELECESQIWLKIECCYQGPQQLDPVQPTQEQIEKMTKDWQNENKKNKNPPPMPDFNQPRMIKPDLVLVQQQNNRPISIGISKFEPGEEAQETEIKMKVDYRQLIKEKRKENQEIKADLAKKAEEQGAKKGGKGPAKGPETELKVNAFVENPNEKDKTLTVYSCKGVSFGKNLQLPDDFPAGNYWLCLNSPFSVFGQISGCKIGLSIKAKNTGKKK